MHLPPLSEPNTPPMLDLHLQGCSNLKKDPQNSLQKCLLHPREALSSQEWKKKLVTNYFYDTHHRVPFLLPTAHLYLSAAFTTTGGEL